MIGVFIEADSIIPTLNLMGERMDDFLEPLTAILADGLFSAQQQVVEGKGAAFSSSPWPGMAPATVAKGRDPGTLLFETGALTQSLTRGGEGNIFEVGPFEGEAGSALTSKRSGYGYAAGQQNGAPNRPPRPYLVWYDDRLPDYDSWIATWILGGEGGNA